MIPETIYMFITQQILSYQWKVRQAESRVDIKYLRSKYSAVLADNLPPEIE